MRWYRDRSGRRTFRGSAAGEGDLVGGWVGPDHDESSLHDEQQAFEWSVEIRQGTIFGNDSAGPVAGLITCDGRFHKVEALVPGANGPYTAGPAEVQALVQLFDADEGSDIELEARGNSPASTLTPSISYASIPPPVHGVSTAMGGRERFDVAAELTRPPILHAYRVARTRRRMPSAATAMESIRLRQRPARSGAAWVRSGRDARRASCRRLWVSGAFRLGADNVARR